ncbi:winged helix-turn-helix transcriptional regulator [Microbacterium sp. LMI12-1-1.1]|uniref:ArsR/SmtB family transcription factor n=1 Tax=Microbacterium sp. LMI12-1-1.1 TaxID=3135225 RepID=UPI0034292AA0
MDPFEALAEPVRRRIIEILASGEHTSGQLADVIGFEFRISRTAVSKHLRLLRNAEYVDVRADENWRWYRLKLSGFATLENAVADLKLKMASAIGWDADAGQQRDPLAVLPVYPAVPFRGPGRALKRGHRGRQTACEPHASPDDIAPVPPMIDLFPAPALRAADAAGDDEEDDDLDAGDVEHLGGAHVGHTDPADPRPPRLGA